MIIKKRQLLLATLIIALGAAVFVNWYYTRPTSEAANAKPSVTAAEAADSAASELGEARYVISSGVTELATGTGEAEYFAAARLKRKTAHDESAEALNAVIKDSASPADAVNQASRKLTALAEELELEGELENLITAKVGCENLVVLNGTAAQVIVEKGALDATTAVQIQDIVTAQTEYNSENITIIELNT